MNEIKVGSLVEFRGKDYWVYEIKTNAQGSKLTLVPEYALEWDTGLLKLNEAFQIPMDKVTLRYESN